LRILTVGAREAYNSEGYYNRALRSLGHDVTHVDMYLGVKSPFLTRYLLTRTPAFQDLSSEFAVNRSLVETARRLRPDVIIIYKGEMISTLVLGELQANHRVFLLYPDAYRYPAIIRAGFYEAIFVETDRTEFYQKLGARRVYTLYQACDPSVHRALGVPYRYDVSFVGALYLNRYLFLRKLKGVDVFTSFWWLPLSQRHESVFGEEYVRVINESRINLNIEHPVHQTANAPHMRIFEVAGCGGFLLSSKLESIQRIFPMAVVWGDASEARELVSQYLEDPAARSEVSEKMRAECYRKHTYLHRAKELTSKM
jgi:spore maturation protein CgeB